MSVDGYIDDTADAPLILSNEADLARVNDVRAGVDAILVGANTIRRDDPRLIVRGRPERPVKVTLTASGDVDPASRFFTVGDSDKLVYTVTSSVAALTGRLAGLATVIDCGPALDLGRVLDDLAGRGVRRLMVEGGGSVHTQFLAGRLADELHLVIAPLFVGDRHAPRFVHDGQLGQPMELAEVRRIGSVVLLRYVFGDRAEDLRRLRQAIELSHRCVPSPTAFSVGCVIVDAEGEEIARAYSRESDPVEHAEEAALKKAGPTGIRGATVYSSLEPCGKRASRPRSCSELLLDAGARRVVFAWREPKTFVDGRGAERLTEAGVEVVAVPELADEAMAANRHLL